MIELCEVKAIVRRECLPELADALQRADVTRFFVSRVHALGGGRPGGLQALAEGRSGLHREGQGGVPVPRGRGRKVRDWACTGRRGDGVVIVSEVKDVVNVRTGDRDGMALI